MKELFTNQDEPLELDESLIEAAFSSSTLGAILSTHIWYIFGFSERLEPSVFKKMTKFFLYGWLSWNDPEIAARAVSVKLDSVELMDGLDKRKEVAELLVKHLSRE